MNLRDLFKSKPSKASMTIKTSLPGQPEVFTNDEGKKYIPEMHLKGFLERLKKYREQQR